jgi:hypothetical protein
LDLRNPSAQTTFAFASIHQHVDPLPCSMMPQSAFGTVLQKKNWNKPSSIARNLTVRLEFPLPEPGDRLPIR